MDFFPSENQGLNSDPATLLVPALSIGNVGQLALDLIISSLQAHKAGYLDDPHVLPCVGNDPFGSNDKGELAVALEVYEELDNNFRIVQQRAPIIKGTMLKFAKNFAVWASNNNTKEVIIVSGVDAGKRSMQDVGSSPISYISTANQDGTDQRCEQLGWKKFEHFLPSSEAWKLLESQSSKEVDEDLEGCEVQLTDEMYFPSLPFASLFSCCKVNGLNALCILLFCSEGDNIQDAFFLGEALQNLFSLKKLTGHSTLNWIVPHSWRSVYGPPPDPTMFY